MGLGDICPLVPELHPMSLLRSDLVYRPFTPLTPQHVQCMEMACSASSCDRRVMNNTFSGFRKDEKWAKVIVHGVPAYVFGDMDARHQELTNFNENTQLAATPRWLTRREAREGKLHSSVLLCFRTKLEADRAIKQGRN